MNNRTLVSRIFILLITTVAFSACGGLSPDLITEHDGVVAENLGEQVNSPYDDYAMFLYRDRLYFTTNRPTHEGYIHGDDLWFSDREADGWSQSLNFGAKLNTPQDEGSPYITSDGEYVYFVQCWTEDGLGDCDLYMARMDYNGKWQEITNLGDRINSKYWDSQPYLSPDGEYLYFASDRPGGHGGSDIWRSKRLRSGRWGEARNLGPEINTSGDEKAPMLAPNGVDLYFSSTGHPGLGGYDLFRSTNVKGETWSLARNVGKPFNSSADDIFWRLTAREDTVIIASSRGGGYGALDMYAVWPNPFKDSTRYIYHVRGMVYDSITEMGIPDAHVRVEPAQGSAFTLKANHNGRYEFRTELARSYRIATSVEGYEPAEKQFTVPDYLYYNEYRQSLPLTPLGFKREAEEKPSGDIPSEIVVSYFAFDKSVLQTEYQEELKTYYKEKIAPLQEADTEFTITLNAHTDDRGTEDYNINLSRRRGAAVSKFLRDLGVPLEVIRINAYGESRPASLGDSKESHAMNRRVELELGTR